MNIGKARQSRMNTVILLKRSIRVYERTKQTHGFDICLPSTNETNELNDNFNNKYYVSVGNIFAATKN